MNLPEFHGPGWYVDIPQKPCFFFFFFLECPIKHSHSKLWGAYGFRGHEVDILGYAIKHRQVTDLDVADLCFSGPRIPFCARGALWGHVTPSSRSLL